MTDILSTIDQKVLDDFEDRMYRAFMTTDLQETYDILNEIRALLGNPTPFNVQNIVQELLFGANATARFMAKVLKGYEQKNSDT